MNAASYTISRNGSRKSTPLIALALAIFATGSDAFSAPALRCTSSSHARASATSLSLQQSEEDSAVEQSRRSVLSSMLTTATVAAGASVAFPSGAFAEAETMERGGVPLTPFNSLAFNYREGESPTVDASAIGEASITYSDFLEKLDSDQVTFVEFIAPNGDAAYATLKSAGEKGEGGGTEKPIRIGEGYPVEDPKGWSSPAFVVKAVAKKGVPYKFVVPGLGDSFKM